MDTKTLFKRYLPAIIALAVIVALVLVFWFVGYLSERKFDAAIDNLQTNSQNEVKQAANHNNAAINAQVTRQIEDGVREKVIKPKLDAARRSSESSKLNLEKARRKYSDEKINPTNLSSSAADNCARLANLYPDTKFEYCRQ
ncbi:MAG TPA: hypothetical protein VF692_04815 [Pyrinomonadaceae bacterium]